MEEKETGIVNAICEYLEIKRYFFWRQNTGGMYRQGRFFRQPKYAKNGIPDIIMVKDGRFIGIEVKTAKGRQGDSQKAFQSGVEEAQGLYYLVRSIDEIIKLGL